MEHPVKGNCFGQDLHQVETDLAPKWARAFLLTLSQYASSTSSYFSTSQWPSPCEYAKENAMQPKQFLASCHLVAQVELNARNSLFCTGMLRIAPPATNRSTSLPYLGKNRQTDLAEGNQTEGQEDHQWWSAINKSRIFARKPAITLCRSTAIFESAFIPLATLFSRKYYILSFLLQS